MHEHIPLVPTCSIFVKKHPEIFSSVSRIQLPEFWGLTSYKGIIMVIEVLFLQRAHSPFIFLNGVQIELGKTNKLKALCMVQYHT